MAAPQTSLFSVDVALPAKADPSLADTAMLSSLNIHKWEGWKFDPHESDALTLRHNAGNKRARVNKKVIPPSELDEINQAAGRARRNHYLLTLPWTDDGWRVLPAATYFEHVQKMKESEAEFKAGVDGLVSRFEEIVRTQKEKPHELGSLFDINDYPGMREESGILRFLFPDELRDKFSFATDVRPISNPEDFRVAIGDAERERLKRRMTESVQASLRTATRDLWQRLYDVVAHMSTRLTEYNAAEEGKKPKLYKSMVSNIVEIVDVLPRLNVSCDAELDQMTENVRRSLLVDTEELKKSETIRSDAARASAEIMQRMAAYMGLPNPMQEPS